MLRHSLRYGTKFKPQVVGSHVGYYRHLSSNWKTSISQASDAFGFAKDAVDLAKDSAVDLSLDQYITFINKSVAKIDQKVPAFAGKQKTITATLNLGVMTITTVIEM